MMRIIVRIFAVVGFLVVLLFGGMVAALWAFAPGAPEVPERVVLEFDFETPLLEKTPEDPLAGLLGGHNPTVRELVAAIDRAAKDDRVKGLVGRIGDSTVGWGATQELRDAVGRFRQSGKFALIHSESFGEAGSGMLSYYLASAFDEVWMQPVGTLGVNGIAAELQVYGGTLEKIYVQPEFAKRHEYKTAAETFMEREPTQANQEMTASLIGDLFDQWVAGVASSRNLDAEGVRAAVDRAPLLDREALEFKLIDRLAYYDELTQTAMDRAFTSGDGPAPEEMDLLDYAGIADPTPPSDAPAVAVIIGSGPIYRGEGNVDPLSGEQSFGPASIAEAFDKAVENESVRGILFRVDSPGGSPVGSEVVRRAVQRAREAGKPVVISMGDVAGSGGYWVAMDADRIVAQPGTLTGSIGVLYGKLVTSGLQEWAGVGTARIEVGANAGMWSSNSSFSESEQERLNVMLDDIYARFTAGVANGRKLPLEKVQEIARGRVYTGRQAQEIGLVDALGGYDVALAQLREVMGLAPDAPVRTLLFPESKSQFAYVMDLISGDVRADIAAGLLSRSFGDVLVGARPVMKTLAPWLAAPSPEETIVMMRPVSITGQGL
ncbi:signal peptide peptidase SppA [Indioceanicola profundi]|uniref:signal peptide peptidase SppA n=1 Tax=Indioceanicola profundi TaxID=2220096 RepID=UPI0013C43A05|nr:signal peptide peptidase SppA [Indioceanicola profundi]